MTSADLRDLIDPEVRARLDLLVELLGPGGLAGVEDIAERRRRLAELTARIAESTFPADVVTNDHTVPGRDGLPSVRVRVYRPTEVVGTVPCIYYVHGGGLVTGSVERDDSKAAALARDVGAVVASVDYRLAPEHPYPAAFEDTVAGLVWLASHHDELDIDCRRIAAYGTSAGGGLAIAAALHARDHGGPDLAFLLLISPMVDDRSSTPSTMTNTGFGAWSREANLQAWRAYLGHLAGSDIPPTAAPARAEDLTGLPPMLVETGDLDLLRDESIAFAQRASQAGVRVELHVHEGAIHGGETLAPTAGATLRARALRVASLRRALGLA